MDWQFVAGLAVGAYLGWGYQRIWAVLRHNVGWRDPEPPAPAQTKLRLVANDITPPSAPMADDEDSRWRLYLTSYAFHGSYYGWSWRALGPDGAGVVRRRAWEVYRELLVAMGELAPLDNGELVWAHGRSYSLLRARVKYLRADLCLSSLPAPAPRRPPAVLIPARRDTNSTAQHTQHTQHAESNHD